MPKSHQQFIQTSLQELLHLLEENPEIESIIGRFRLTAVLGFLIEMAEVYPIDVDQQKRLITMHNLLTTQTSGHVLTDLN